MFTVPRDEIKFDDGNRLSKVKLLFEPLNDTVLKKKTKKKQDFTPKKRHFRFYFFPVPAQTNGCTWSVVVSILGLLTRFFFVFF